MNEQQFGNNIKQALNQGIPVSITTLARLQTSRKLAIEKQRIGAISPVLSWAGNVGSHENKSRAIISAFLLPTLILVIGLIAVNAWYRMQQAEETVEIDAAVLTGELPIDAYLDKGFGAWLRHSSD